MSVKKKKYLTRCKILLVSTQAVENFAPTPPPYIYMTSLYINDQYNDMYIL